MKTIPCRCGQDILVDDHNFELFSQSAWDCQSGQVTATINGESRSMASFILGRPAKLIIDHKNRQIHDNQRENLRFVDAAQSAHNVGIRKDNTSGYKGVSFHKASGKYRAYISLKTGNDRNLQHLGTFPTIEEAARAYNKKAKELFGDYAVLNKV